MLALPAFSQSTTSGDVVGVVSDPTGAVLPKASVTAKSDATGVIQKTTTNEEGFYRFSLLQPGAYTITAGTGGFEEITRKVRVSVGQVTTANVQLGVKGTSTTIEVTASPMQVENGDVSTGFGSEQISQMPNPGNDLSAIAQTAPGVVMNTQGGFGNFSSFGLPGTSNLFTIDGQNDNDPFLNLNNSGATNLLLGANDVQEATVTSNGYSGQFGQLAGAQVNYVTKSGSNEFHGNAIYYWNGRALNANDYRNNLQVQGGPSTPRPFDNINQWAVSFGGPIRKEKTFFFFNYEGLRVVLPTSGTVRIPSLGFEQATIQNLMTTGLSASVPFYQNIFNLYNQTPGAATGTPAPCPSFSGGPDCALVFQNTATNFTREYQMSLRIDQKFSDKDSMYGRVQTDRGVQATATDRINPLFNAQSTQPEYQGQLSETHVFSPNAINEFKMSASWYSAIFSNANRAATLAAFPTTLAFSGGFSTLGRDANLWPQGRNVTQYQLTDDFSLTRGKHTWKFGGNFRRNDVTDFDYGMLTSGLAVSTVDTFFAGGVDNFTQAFPTRLSQPIALYGLGVYAQDEWRLTKKLRLTLALRLDHNSNPVCQTNCFAELTGPFTSLNHDPTIPYNQVIKTGLHQAYPATDALVWQPRLGFAYSPFSNDKTIVRGGIGIFSDSFAAVLVDNFSSNAPVLNQFVVTGNLSPVQGNNVFQVAHDSNQAFLNGFTAGQTLAQIQAADPFFAPPGVTASDKSIRQPRYEEWNLEVQHNVGVNTVLSLNYVGNHGIFEAVQNNGVNGFADAANFPGGFTGLPSAAPDQRFGIVNQIQSIAVSNYNGLVTSVKHQFNRGFAFQVNYTWSHTLDEVSNGGLLPFNFNTNTSPLNPFNPFNIRQNYGNADYDVRHYFSANYVWDNSLRHLFKWGPNALFGGWTISGTLFSRSGLPFTVIDSGTAAFLNADNFGGTVPAQIVGATANGGCGKANATPDPATGNVGACLSGNGFASPASLAFNQGRNQFRGPNYFNTDLTVMKHTKIPGSEHAELAVGFQFFNLLNHPNFDQPVNDFAAFNNTPGAHPQVGDFGTIISTVNTPTSILGSFLGGDASPRLIQLKAEFKF
jgi:outer membrane receptor protein involved in Fe transport